MMGLLVLGNPISADANRQSQSNAPKGQFCRVEGQVRNITAISILFVLRLIRVLHRPVCATAQLSATSTSLLRRQVAPHPAIWTSDAIHHCTCCYLH